MGTGVRDERTGHNRTPRMQNTKRDGRDRRGVPDFLFGKCEGQETTRGWFIHAQQGDQWRTRDTTRE